MSFIKLADKWAAKSKQLRKKSLSSKITEIENLELHIMAKIYDTCALELLKKQKEIFERKK